MWVWSIWGGIVQIQEMSVVRLIFGYVFQYVLCVVNVTIFFFCSVCIFTLLQKQLLNAKGIRRITFLLFKARAFPKYFTFRAKNNVS